LGLAELGFVEGFVVEWSSLTLIVDVDGGLIEKDAH
jgi:hypothetical protein